MNNTIFFFFNLAKHRLKIIEQGYFTIDQILTSASLAASCALQKKKINNVLVHGIILFRN
jgi:uncharacterized membrane protein